MVKHSKNSTAKPFLTNDERSRLEYGTKTMRVGSDSLLKFTQCHLCLAEAIQPVCCDKGHTYCKECILSNILSQKKEIAKYNETAKEHNQKIQVSQPTQSYEDTFTDKKNQDEKKQLPFWMQNKEAPQEALPLKETTPQCINHPISLKKLRDITFKLENKETICPTCLKPLVNSCYILKCSHALCQTCVLLSKKTGKCSVCDQVCKYKDVIKACSEGTGFSSKGVAQVSRQFLAFQ